VTNPVDELAQRLGAHWPNIAGARLAAAKKLAEYSDALRDSWSPDAAIVFYGSLARHEWTSGSDVDWTLLVDGPAVPDRMRAVREIRDQLAKVGATAPSVGGAFGSMSFSHELVHRIGGDADTNRITTQRVLLLLESVAIADLEQRQGNQALVHRRVIRAILDSYLEESDGTWPDGVPRFLLNDVVRYWRTIAVDSAAKAREQGDAKWAIRRLKLRTSRKLIFAAGLVMALERYGSKNPPANRAELLDSLSATAEKTPLDIIAGVALRDPKMELYAREVFDAYDAFLMLLDEPAKRDRLEKITRSEASPGTDPVFLEARKIGRDFGTAIERFFFDGSYAQAIRTYGVF
jgi:hypothetical protein